MGLPQPGEWISAEQCRAVASEYKRRSLLANISNDRAFIMKNISRSLMGLATQLDSLAIKTREEGGKRSHEA